MPISAGSRSNVPGFTIDEVQHRRKISSWAFEVNRGHLNNTGTFTLTINVASTAITDERAGAFSFIGLMPQTANAAAELGNGTLYIATQGKKSFTITHANNAQADRTFRYCILG